MVKTTDTEEHGKAKAGSAAKSKARAKSAAKPKAKPKAKAAAKSKTKAPAKPKAKAAARTTAAAKKAATPSKGAASPPKLGRGVPVAVAATLANAQEQLAALNDSPSIDHTRNAEAMPAADSVSVPSTDQDLAVAVTADIRPARTSPRPAFEQMPAGFWPAVNILCDRPEAVREAYRQGHGGPGSLRAFLGVILLAGAAYGAAMGATNTLQGTSGFLAMIPLSAVKLPILLLITYAFAFAPLYFATRFLGYSFTAVQAAKLLLAATAVTAATAASAIPIGVLFAATTASFPTMQLLHGILLAIGVVMGALFFATRSHAIHGRHATIRPLTLMTIYVVLHALIAVQWAAVTGPYIGDPNAAILLMSAHEAVLETAR